MRYGKKNIDLLKKTFEGEGASFRMFPILEQSLTTAKESKMKYYLLVENHSDLVFGDYDLDTLRLEKEYYEDIDKLEDTKSSYRILVLPNDRQETIDNHLANLRGRK